MGILRGVIKKSFIIIIPAAVVSAFLNYEKMPAGIIIGGLLGVLNLRGLVRTVEGFVGSQRAGAVVVFSSMFRLFALFAAIFILMYLKLVNVFGMLFGFTVVFALILFEGMKAGKEM